MKKNSRSQRHKADKFFEKSTYLLEHFSWDKEERILLEIMTTKLISMSDMREVNWTEVSEGIGSIIIRGIEFKMSDETLDDFRTALKTSIDFSGDEIDRRNTLHMVISHQTAKEIAKTLLRSDD